MTVDSINGKFVKETRDGIKKRIENALVQNIDNPDLTSGSIYDSIAESYSTVLADEQEDALQQVYRAAYLPTAENENLEKVVSLLGIERRAAVHATGTIQFSHDDPVLQDYTIPNSTTVQTDETDAVKFDTTETVELSLYDDFEGTSPLDNYSGGTGQFNTSTANPKNGTTHIRSLGGGDVKLDGSDSSVGKTHVLYTYFDSANSGTAGHYTRLRYLVDPGDVASADFVELNENTGDIRIITENDGTAVTTSVTVPTDEYLELHVTPNEDDTVDAVVYDSTGSQVVSTSASVTHNRYDGEVGFGAGTSTIDIDTLTTKAVSADIRAVNGGVNGNVGVNSLTIMPSTVGGVDSLTNRYAIGNDDIIDTDGDRFVAGQAEETDEELRERATNVSGKGGAATIDALIGGVLDVTSVTSVTLFENDTDTDNTGSGGLPPVSFEMVVNGGDTTDIAQAIFNEKAATARDYGGANGTDTTDVATAINDQEFTIHFSRPNVQAIDMTIDLVHDDTYGGDTAVREAIITYIGGTDTNGAPVVGLDVGEDVIINEIEQRVMDVAGVIGIDSSGSSYTPTTTTDGNGLEVISIGANEVAETDGTDGSITITKTEV